MKRRIRLTEGDLRRIVNKSVRRVLRESNEELGGFYVSADVNSEYFDTYDEAYEYALKLAKNEKDWYEPIDIMDNENWQTITRFDEDGIHNF